MLLPATENLPAILNWLGWTLLHFLWQGILIAALARAALVLLRKRAANFRYAVLCAALVLMLLAPILTFIFIQNSGGERFLAIDETHLIGGDSQISSLDISFEKSLNAPNFSENGDANAANKRFLVESLRLNLEAAFPWLVSLWLAGVLFLSLRMTFDWFAVRKLKRGAAKKLDEWQPTVKRLAARLGINRSVRLLESSLVKVPVAVGWLKPLILLPAGMILGLTPPQLEAIIAHELAHVRRHDYLVNIFQTIAEILLFYHPAVLWLSRQIRIEREYACDDLAIACCCDGDALVYARALTKVEKIRKAAPVLATAASGGSLENRVRRLVDASYRQSSASGVSGGLIFLLMLAVAAVGWQTISAGKTVNSATQAAENFVVKERENSSDNKPFSDALAAEVFPGEDLKLRQISLAALENHHGSVIVMNPQTGKIYTIVNQDLAFRTEWHPASIFKLVTSLAALDENKIKGSEKIFVPGLAKSLTLNDALAVSENDFFERLGERVGAETLLAAAREFGLGKQTGINLPGEIAGKLPQASEAVDAGILGKYGQDVKATPLQIAVMTSALANQGKLVRPFVVQPENSSFSPQSLKTSPETIAQIVGGMRAVVEKGTGKGAFNRNFAIAGKTGTAQIDDGDIGLFASFAPVENPRLVVVVAIKEPDANGLRASEIAGKIYRALGDFSWKN